MTAKTDTIKNNIFDIFNILLSVFFGLSNIHSDYIKTTNKTIEHNKLSMI